MFGGESRTHGFQLTATSTFDSVPFIAYEKKNEREGAVNLLHTLSDYGKSTLCLFVCNRYARCSSMRNNCIRKER